MALIITDDTLAKAQMTADELLIDLACYLYDKKRMSMGQARHLAELDQISFQKELAKILGILGVLIQAKQQGAISSVKTNIEKLIEIGFRLDKKLIAKVLGSLGEE